MPRSAILGHVYWVTQFKFQTQGGATHDTGRTTIVECGRETINNQPLRSNYTLKEFPYYVSWEESKDNATKPEGGDYGRLPSLEELRVIIAQKSGNVVYNSSVYS